MRTIMDIKMHLCISWILLGLLGELGDTVFRGKCQSEGYFEFVLNNSRLRNYVISTRDVHSLQDCVAACLGDERCSSCNFHVSGVPLHKCELNIISRSSARPGSLVIDNGYQYYEIRDSKETKALCETVGCQNGGSCQENCETLAFPHYICRCPSFFTGKLCEIRKTGNFLLNYNSSTMDDHTSVSVTGKNFNYLSVYVWVKPSSSSGVVFSYATENNPREMALLFNETNVVLHLGGHVVPFNLTLPVNQWSQICFIFYNKVMLKIYHNGLIHNTVNVPKLVNNTTELPHKITVKGTGTLVAGFEQVSPGKVNKNSSSNLTMTRLYVLDKSELANFEILRLFNEPYFSVVAREFRVDWTEFHQPKASPDSTEPDLGNYDLRFPGNPNVTIDITYMPPLNTFFLSMWIRVNMSRGKDASIFELDSGTGTVLKIKRRGKEFDFFFNCSNSTIKLSYQNVITDENWFHLIFQWAKHSHRLHLYKHGSQMYTRANLGLNVTLPEIHNGTIKIGDGHFVGDITSLNLWSVVFYWNMIVSLALNPGNAAGDLFSWKSLREQGYLENYIGINPSTCHQRPGQFDLIFPERNQNTVNYIYMESVSANKFNSITAAFWIKIPSSADEFTLISYAVPGQVNEFSVHFGTTGIWVYLYGNQRFIPLKRSKLLNKWHHFIISYSSRSGILLCHHNGKQIAKDRGLSKSLIAKDAVLVIGAQQSHYKDMHEPRFQFTGELSQLQIYRRTFAHGMIRTFSARCSNVPGNFFRWADMSAGVRGHVRRRHQSECLKAKNGEVD